MTNRFQDRDPFDPTVDIFVGLASVIFLAILLILPLAQIQSDRAQTLNTITQQISRPLDLTAAGAPTLQILAQAHSITLVQTPENRVFHQDQMIGNQDLNAVLQASKHQGLHPVVFVDTSGQEAAFLLETILAQHDFPNMSRVFLDQDCGFLRHTNATTGCGAQ